MTPPTVPTITLTRPDEVVSALPHILGFVPAESLVVLCLGVPGGGPTMRVDLPPPAADAEAVRMMAGHVARAGTTRAVVVVWTDEPDGPAGPAGPTDDGPVPDGREPGGQGPDRSRPVGWTREEWRSATVSRSGGTRGVRPRTGLVAGLHGALAAEGIELAVVLLVRRGRWWSFSCPGPCCPGGTAVGCDQPCCPADGWELPAVPGPGAVRVAAEAVGAGRVVLPGRDALVAAVTATGTAAQWRTRTAAVRRARRAEVVLHGRDGADAVRRRTYRSARDALRAVEAGTLVVPDLDDDLAATLTVGLEDRTARDLVITLALDHDLGMFLALLAEVARRTPDSRAAPVCTVLAWVAYQRGDGALARVALDRALRHRPDYAMAQLLERGLSQLVPPAHVERVTRAVRADLAAGSTLDNL